GRTLAARFPYTPRFRSPASSAPAVPPWQKSQAPAHRGAHLLRGRRAGSSHHWQESHRPGPVEPTFRTGRSHRTWWPPESGATWEDRKSTRLNSSHAKISYAVFCLKKKNKQ